MNRFIAHYLVRNEGNDSTTAKVSFVRAFTIPRIDAQSVSSHFEMPLEPKHVLDIWNSHHYSCSHHVILVRSEFLRMHLLPVPDFVLRILKCKTRNRILVAVNCHLFIHSICFAFKCIACWPCHWFIPCAISRRRSPLLIVLFCFRGLHQTVADYFFAFLEHSNI